jgi:uncharacterized protein (TIGR00251 family)
VSGEGSPAEELDLREAKGGGLTLRVRVQPRASREAVGGLRGGALVVRLTAPPVEGSANAALCRLLGKTLGLAPSAVSLLRGAASRDKLVRIEGLGREAARLKLGDLLRGSG